MKQHIFSCIFLIFYNCSFAQSNETLTVNFDFNKYDLTPEAMAKLDGFVEKIANHSISSIQLNGYCDSKGSDVYNQALSINRLRTVRQYLAKNKNLNATYTVTGFGEKDLLNNEATEDECHQNRRVTLVALIKQTTAAETKTLTAMLEDTTVKKGSVITIPNLEFENNSDVLLDKSKPTLGELYNVLVKNPKLTISIEGHICCVPQAAGVPFTESPNFQVSMARAAMVYNYLIKSGISSKRMRYTAFGSSRPLYPIPEKSEAEMVANRRVEIRIVDK